MKNDLQSESANDRTHTNLSDAEVLALLNEANQQYKEYTRIVGITRIRKENNINPPIYSWENPIGLVLTRGLDA